jgi:hypothetical protein
MGLVSGLVTFVVSALIGGLGIYVGAQLVAGEGSYTEALVTALVGAVVWAVVGTVFGLIPLLGPLVTLLAYLAVLKFAYGVNWVEAGAIALVAWLTLLVVFVVLGPLLGVFDAVGVPGI